MGQSSNTSQVTQEIIELESLILTIDDLSSGKLNPAEIYELSIDGAEYGPLMQSDIQTYLSEHPEIYPKTKITLFGEDKWTPITEHPVFQRRKPQLVSAENFKQAADDHYFLLTNGQKDGPYSSDQINKMLLDKEIILTDQISSDNGVSWCKLYQIEQFDRRNNQSMESLPPMPEENILKKSDDEVVNSLQAENSEEVEKDAMASLAFIGHVKSGKVADRITDANVSGKAIEKEIKKKSPADIINSNDHKVMKKRIIIVASGIVALLLLSIFVSYLKQRSTSRLFESPATTVKQNKNKQLKKSNVTKKAKVSKRNSRSQFFKKSRSKNKNISRNKSPFRRSKGFRKASRSPASRNRKRKRPSPLSRIDELQNDFPHDAINDPVELDPIRRKLAKETIDPENEDYIDEPREADSEEEFAERDEGYDSPDDESDDFFEEEISY